MGACEVLPNDHVLCPTQLADFCACRFDETDGVQVPEHVNLDMVTTPLCDLCLCVKLEVLYVGKEVVSKCGANFLSCNKSGGCSCSLVEWDFGSGWKIFEIDDRRLLVAQW